MTHPSPPPGSPPSEDSPGGSRPLGPAVLTRRAQTALWVLRIVAIVLTAMVVYTFVAGLR